MTRIRRKNIWGLVWSFLQLLANGKYDANNPWHALASQLIRSLPLVDCDKMISEASALRDQVAKALDRYVVMMTIGSKGWWHGCF